MSNFVRQRGFLDPNRLLHAPQFSNAPKNIRGMAEPSNLSATNMMSNIGNQNEMSSNT